MNKDLDIQVVEALKAYLASGVEDQVDYQKFYLYSIVTRSTAYRENDTVNLHPDTVNDTVNSQNDTVSELKEGLKRIYIAIQKNPELPIHNLWKSSTSPNQLPSEQPEILRN